MIRRLAVHIMYVTAEAIQLAADNLSPPGDEVWRDRAWKRYLMNKGRLDEYAGMTGAPRPRSRALQQIKPPACWTFNHEDAKLDIDVQVTGDPTGYQRYLEQYGRHRADDE